MLGVENRFSFLSQESRSLRVYTIQEKQTVFQNRLLSRITITSVKCSYFLLFQPVYWLSHNYHLCSGCSSTIQGPSRWHWTQSCDLMIKKYIELMRQDKICEQESPNETRIREWWHRAPRCAACRVNLVLTGSHLFPTSLGTSSAEYFSETLHFISFFMIF